MGLEALHVPSSTRGGKVSYLPKKSSVIQEEARPFLQCFKTGRSSARKGADLTTCFTKACLCSEEQKTGYA